jgi:hypothetical protein
VEFRFQVSNNKAKAMLFFYSVEGTPANRAPNEAELYRSGAMQ